MAQNDPENPLHVTKGETENYAHSLQVRVRSFHTDPLHSAAYLGNLAHFLQKPYQKPNPNPLKQTRRPEHRDYTPKNLEEKELPPFIYEYAISSGAPPELKIYNRVEEYTAITSDPAYNIDCNELVFLAGRPSAEWLCAVGSRYNLDHRFFHHHLRFLNTRQRDWFTTPTLPSRSYNVLRLCVPSMLFLGEDRYVSLDGLQKIRRDGERRLREDFKSIQEETAAQVGGSIVRRINVHDGASLVIEQEISSCLLQRGEKWTVLVWTDSGDESSLDSIPAFTTGISQAAADRVAFCPVFFEKELSDNPPLYPPTTGIQKLGARQPLSSLAGNYGHTLDWTKAAQGPLSVIEELFSFHTASELQYLNMLENIISEDIREAESKQEGTDISSILHFDYSRSILIRHKAHIETIVVSLDTGLKTWKQAGSRDQTQHQDEDMLLTLKADLNYLSNRMQNAISLCEAGRSTTLSNIAIEETKRSSREAVLVTGLTKATNRLTFIFLPISFVTSAFGMNFRQFGQGHLTIWLWVAITLPLLACCIVMVERGGYLRKLFLRWLRIMKEKMKKSV